MCGAISPLFNDLNNPYDKLTLDDLLLVLKNFSSNQINCYLGLMFGSSPSITYPMFIDDMYYSGNLVREEAGKIWDTKYANSIPGALKILEGQCVINKVAINNIARNIFMNRHNADIVECFYDITNRMIAKDKDILKSIIFSSIDNLTEYNYNIGLGAVSNVFYMIKEQFRDGKLTMSDEYTFRVRVSGVIESEITKMMESEILSSNINKDSIRNFCLEVMNEFRKAVNGYGSAAKDKSSDYLILTQLQKSTPENFKLSYSDYEIIVKNILPASKLWNIK